MSSVAQMYQGFLGRKVEFRLFNGNPEPVETNYDGQTYVIPGREQFYVERKTREQWPEPGVLPIKGHGGKVFKKKGKVVEQHDPITAQQIIEFIVGPDGVTGKLGRAGVRVLLPDGDEDGRNDLIRKDAIETADKKRYEDAQGIVRTFERANARRIEFKQDPLPPNDVQRAAYKFIAQKDAEGSVQAFAFSCPKCFDGARTTEELRNHITTIHKAQAGDLLTKANLALEEPVPVKRGPGRPRATA